MNSQLNTKIMRRVYMIWAFRQIVNPFTLQITGSAVLFAALRQYVSIKQVFYNSPSFLNPAEALKFFSHAFLNTTTTVELLTVGLLILGLFLVRDGVRRFKLGGEYQALLGNV